MLQVSCSLHFLYQALRLCSIEELCALQEASLKAVIIEAQGRGHAKQVCKQLPVHTLTLPLSFYELIHSPDGLIQHLQQKR